MPKGGTMHISGTPIRRKVALWPSMFAECCYLNDRMKRENIEKTFNEYWERYQKQLILNAPSSLREEYLKSTQLDTPVDWFCFVLPIVVGVGLFPLLNFGSEMLSWLVVVLVVVVLFALMQMLKPYLSKKKTTAQVVDRIKAYYFEIYKKSGDIESLDDWRM